MLARVARAVGHWFAHAFPRRIMQQGANVYYECRICGERTVINLQGAGYTPVDRAWLNRQPRRAPMPPQGGSGVPSLR
jgi:hypothetical protein